MTCACGCGQPTKVATRTISCLGHVRGQPIPYLRGHANKKNFGVDTLDIFVVVEGDCWTWRHRLRDGYGRLRLNDRTVQAHRAVWELLVGPIPDGLQLDHLCRVRRCVNPDHLEPVTQAENMARGAVRRGWSQHLTHCSHGHEMTTENTYRPPSYPLKRMCRTCLAERGARRKQCPLCPEMATNLSWHTRRLHGVTLTDARRAA